MARKPPQFFRKICRFLKAAPLLALLTALLVAGIGANAPAAPGQPDAGQLERQGRELYQSGHFDEAAQVWEQAAEIYQQGGDYAGTIQSRLNQAQALRALGFYRRAERTLTDASAILKAELDSPLKAAGLRHLGNALRLVGNLGNLDYLTTSCEISQQNSETASRSGQVLRESLEIAQRLKDSQAIGAALFSIGNTARALSERERAVGQKEQAQQEAQKALACYKQAATTAVGPTTKLRARLNTLSLLAETEQWLLQPEQESIAADWLPQIQSEIQAQIARWRDIEAEISQLPLSRTAIYARIDLAQSLMKWSAGEGGNRGEKALPVRNSDIPSSLDIAQLVSQTVRQARELKDPRSESYALGNLGGVYEQAGQFSDAREVTEKALNIARKMNAPDIAYRWEWQLGRLLKEGGNIEGAIAAYQAAVADLNVVRKDLAAINSDVQFSFRDEVEPVYRQLVELLLPSPGSQPNQKNLEQARLAIAALQVAELENFLRCTLQVEKSVPVEEVASKNNAAIIYPIILPKRLAVIVKLPEPGDLLYYDTPVSKFEVERELNLLAQKLEEPSFSQSDRKLSEKVYKWLVQPAESYPKTPLDPDRVKTLVFVLDGRLKKIPMAALHDGKQYLVKKYAVALNLGLDLPKPQPFQEKPLQVLAAGLSKPVRELSEIPAVGSELQKINELVSSRELRDEKFLRKQLESLLKSRPFSVVHLATHAEFSSQPEKTVIEAWDDSIDVSELSEIFRKQSQNRPDPIELLVLSACRTAQGDERAVLGLAGVAVRSGARSTIAGLWYLFDQSSAVLMGRFYRYLKDPNVANKAEALRRAQLDLLEKPEYKNYDKPSYWAPYVLLGNWL